MKFIHITDLHIMPDGRKILGTETAARARRMVADINANHGDAALCIATGDITAHGDTASCETARDILAGLNMPVHCLIGNHDHREKALKILPGVKADQAGFAQSVVQTPVGAFVLLDTKDDSTHGGAYCAVRQAWLTAQLADLKGQNVYIFMHHAPFPTGLKAMDTIGLNADHAEKLATLLQDHGQVRHLFFGHYHRPMSGQWHGIPFSCHRSLMLQCALDLETDTHVDGKYEEPQYVVVLVEDGKTIVHYHDFDSAAAMRSLGEPEGG